MSQWQPIESAPQYERILLWQGSQAAVGERFASSLYKIEIETSDGHACLYFPAGEPPTHWMPLPPPPEAE